MTEEQGYNGWTNYPTWCVALWLGNEPSTYDETRALARLAIENRNEGVGELPEDSRDSAMRAAFADELKEYVGETAQAAMPDLFEDGSFVLDLYGWAMGQVDWLELATNYLEEVSQDA